MIYPAKLWLVLLAMFCLSRSARAWNAEGHMVTAQIAYNHLTPTVKAKCDALIALSVFDSSSANSNFVTAACWADDIKSDTSTYNIWHYIDIPFNLSQDGTSTNIAPASFDVVRAINLCVAALQNPNTSPSNQAVNLRFLLHFVGDIEQPLHASTEVSARWPKGDAGGNDFSLSGSPNNLHSLWDQGGDYLTDSVSRTLSSGRTTISNKAADVEATFPYVASTNPIPNPMIWATEGWNLAQTVTYVGITSNTVPTAGYISNVHATTRQRMAVGGQRLADLLNAIFTPVVTNAPTLGSLSKASSGAFRFQFTNLAGASFTVFANSNLNLPINTWSNLGAASELPVNSGQFQFSDSQATANARRFYRVRSP
jgi:hypothetical protein